MPYLRPLRTADEVRDAGFDPGHTFTDDRITQWVLHVGLLEHRLTRAGLLSPDMQASLDFLHTLLSDQGLELDRLRSRELAR